MDSGHSPPLIRPKAFFKETLNFELFMIIKTPLEPQLTELTNLVNSKKNSESFTWSVFSIKSVYGREGEVGDIIPFLFATLQILLK